MEGLFLVNKPQGMSSRNCGEFLKSILNLSKVGHVGTLDVEASGLLLILSNRATKLQNYLLSHKKIYEGIITLGISSSTDDIFGEIEVHEDSNKILSNLDKEKTISLIISTFSPQYDQFPPLVSAKKHKGKKSYDLVRKGITPELSPKKISLKFLDLRFTEDNKLFYSIEVSSGFYVRSLARDIGELLGVGGLTESINRTSVGDFLLENAIDVDVINKKIIFENKSSYFICLEDVIRSLGYKEFCFEDQNQELEFLNGNKVALNKLFNKELFNIEASTKIAVFSREAKSLGIVGFEESDPRYEVVFPM